MLPILVSTRICIPGLYMVYINITLIVLSFSLSFPALGAYIRYGGFSIENIQFQKRKFKNSNKGRNLDDGFSCIGIMEISPYLEKRVFYSQEEFVFLMKNKPGIAKHFGKKIGFGASEFIHYLAKSDNSKRSRCVSVVDIEGFIKTKPKPSTKSLRVLRRVKNKEQSYFAFLKSKNHEQAFSWSGVISEQYIIREYSDSLEESEKDWNGGYDFHTVRKLENPDLILKLGQRFLSFYESLGRLEIKSSHGHKHLKKINSQFNTLDFLRYARDEASTLKLNRRFNLIEGLKYSKPLAQPVSLTIASIPSLLGKEAPKNEKENFLLSLAAQEDKSKKKYSKRLGVHKRRIAKIPAKLNGATRTMGEYMSLHKKIENGSGTKRDRRRYQELRSEIEFGIRPKEKSKAGKIRHSVKRFLRFYNYYGTDTVVDKYMDYAFNLNIKQMQPMGKKRYLAYRMAKGGDGFFVLSTSIMGYTLIPFTGGLSLLVANMVNVGTTGFFSVLTSLTRNEPLDSHFYRLGMRSIHTFVEGFVPIWTDLNGFFTAIDDIRVASSIDQHLSRWFKRKNQVIKVRPESLGRPFILSLLRERYNYLAFGLLPTAKTLYFRGNFDESQKYYFEKTLRELTNVKVYLEKALLKSALRYEYLLEFGKIPDHMIYDVSRHLKQYHHHESIFCTDRYSDVNILKSLISGQAAPYQLP